MIIFKANLKPISILILGLAFVIIFSFLRNFYLPIWCSVLLFGFEIYFVVKHWRKGTIGIMVGFLFLAYLLPFIHFPTYLFYDFSSDPLILWGLASNKYNTNQSIVMIMGMIIMLGGLGMCFVVSIFPKCKENNVFKFEISRRNNVMSFGIWIVWVVLGIFFSIISTPTDTIFSTQYATTSTNFLQINLSSGWLISYCIMTFALVDLLYDQDLSRKSYKSKVFFLAFIYIVVWLQFFRGDRESVPWIIAVGICVFHWGRELKQIQAPKKRPLLKLVLLFLPIFFITSIIGGIRSGLTDKNFTETIDLILELYSSSENFDLSNFFHGTWSAVLLTPLSVAGDYYLGLLNFRFGSDYFDLFMSLPPGFMADFFGYVRPIDGSAGPALQMTFGQGGTHASVLPFRNFGIVGVWVVPMIWTYIFMYWERKSLRNNCVKSLTLLTYFTAVIPHFVWYGEKNAINATLIYLFLSFSYVICSQITKNSVIQKII
jgi:hypothetical protein